MKSIDSPGMNSIEPRGMNSIEPRGYDVLGFDAEGNVSVFSRSGCCTVTCCPTRWPG